MAYEQLPIIEVELDHLVLDLENYRIPTRQTDELGALKYLFASEDVLEAARLILRDGYFDNEVPIVIENSTQDGESSFIVLEGNRRVSALKAFRDPTLVPGHESALRSLLKRYALEAQNLPERIRVLVAPDRASAAPHVARLHTGISKRRWSRDQQATFYYSLIDDQTTVDDVKAQYPDVEVARFMKMAVMRRFLAAAPFSDPSLHQYATNNDLTMSSFEYAYRNKDIASAIGLEFDKDGFLLPRSSTPEKIVTELPENNLRALEYLVNEFRAGRLNTRSPELKKRSEEFLPFVNRLSSIAKEPQKTENSNQAPSSSPSSSGNNASSSSTKADTENQPQSGPSSARDTRGPNHPDTKDTLDLSGLDYNNAPVNLKVRYFELRSISISKLPIAAAILMRSVLEATIKVHFESTPTPVSGELKAIFPQVIRSYGQNKALQTPINTIQSGNAQKPGSIQWFNVIAHSADAIATADDVRQAWKLVSPLLRRLLLSPT